MDPPPKRRRLSNDGRDTPHEASDEVRLPFPRTLGQPVSPPLRERPRSTGPSTTTTTTTTTTTITTDEQSAEPLAQELASRRVVSSPFQLTWVQDLPDAANTDAVTLRDLLGDPLIAECWDFNYLHDVDFLMAAFDPDVRDLVQVHLVHGFWKKEDESRLMLQEQAKAYKNVTLHCAFMPEMFGTHHSKMLILIRHDDAAQVIIHTANMIARDWTNMTQAVWKSPLLPLLRTSEPDIPPFGQRQQRRGYAVGSGRRFKVDLLNYLGAYNRRRPVCEPLVAALRKFDFAAVRGALVASVPGRHNVYDETEETEWGWAALKRALRHIPVQEGGESEIVIQVSSIATLGPTDTWLRRTLFDALKASKNRTTGVTTTGAGAAGREEPSFKIVFPTPDEIRRSLDGYVSGASIHTKIQSAQQAKQLLYLKPMFCHWANDSPKGQELHSGSPNTHEAGRKRAAPHIKTYIRYRGGGGGGGGGRGAAAADNKNNDNDNENENENDKNENPTIDWALTTSANLSKQAWGEAANGAGEVRIASWEIGVLVWPSLFASEDDGADDDTVAATTTTKMVGTFQKDTPDTSSTSSSNSNTSTSSTSGAGTSSSKEEEDSKKKRTGTGGVGGADDDPVPHVVEEVVVGLRIPYNLPLQGYGADEKPWVATASHPEPDWKGQMWTV